MNSKTGCVASILLLLLLLGALILGVYMSFVRAFTPEHWTLDKINDSLSIPVPTDAANLSFDGHLGRGGYLMLEFQASPESIAAFVSQLCDGVLYDGYDPFKAIDVAEPYTFAHPMHLDIYSYYSYSIGLPNAIKGNRCLQSRPGYQVQVRVDTSEAQVYAIKLHLSFSCDVGCPYLPLNVTKPVGEFPLTVLGLRGAKNPYKLAEREVCINIDNSNHNAEKWGYLKDARIEIKVDGQILARAVLNGNSQLLSRTNTNGAVTAEASGGLWYYCVDVVSNRLINSNRITLSIVIDPTTQTATTYTWQIEIE
ncbi:MAG: hypothetical protein KF716_20670 [Anaerolineae bacterium]|nr:hypothetical protein [Anaerolineae bacterium]